MQTCETCRHWSPPAASGHATQMLAGWGSCEQAEGQDLAPVRPEALAWARDPDGYKADLMTKLNFGCVMHERKLPPVRINPPFTAA